MKFSGSCTRRPGGRRARGRPRTRVSQNGANSKAPNVPVGVRGALPNSCPGRGALPVYARSALLPPRAETRPDGRSCLLSREGEGADVAIASRRWRSAERGDRPAAPPVPVTRAGSDSRPGGSALEAPGRRGWNHLMGETGREKPPSFGTSSREIPGHGGKPEPSSPSPRHRGGQRAPAGHSSLGI